MFNLGNVTYINGENADTVNDYQRVMELADQSRSAGRADRSRTVSWYQ